MSSFVNWKYNDVQDLPLDIWVISPENKGCGFPWLQYFLAVFKVTILLVGGFNPSEKY